MCFLWGRCWILKYYLDKLRLQNFYRPVLNGCSISRHSNLAFVDTIPQQNSYEWVTKIVKLSNQKKVTGLCLDIPKALGRVRPEGLILKLFSLNISCNITRLLAAYLIIVNFTYLRTLQILPYILPYLVSLRDLFLSHAVLNIHKWHSRKAYSLMTPHC
jgi:hypothetical protein